MSATATIPLFLKMEAVFEIQAVDEWYDPIDFVPGIGMDGNDSILRKRIYSVAIDFFSRSDHSDDSLLYSETLYTDLPLWSLRQNPRIFLQREIKNTTHPHTGTATIDLSDIEEVRLENGFLMLGAERFSKWEDGNAELGFDPETRWFFCGERVPQMDENFFVSSLDIVKDDWLKLIADSRFIRNHTRSPLANSITLAYALSDKQEFIFWLANLPAERIRQLPVLPATMDRIIEQKRRLGLPD